VTIALLLLACAAGPAGTSDEAAYEAAAPGALRIDVYPPAEVGGAPALPQSHFVEPSEGGYAPARIDLYPTRAWEGTLRAEVATDWSRARRAPPTELLPIEATVSLRALPGVRDRVGATTARTTPEDGAWTLVAPWDPSLQVLDVVPADPGIPTVRVEAGEEDGPVAVSIPLGVPVWGRVHDRSGVAIEGASLRLVQVDDDGARPESAPIRTDAGGWFAARVAAAGSYRLRLEGGALPGGTRILPDLATEIVVDAADGAEVDLDVGELGRVIATASVQLADGSALRGAFATFTSVELAGSPGSLTVQAEADTSGNLYAALPPGRWTGIVFAPYDTPATPVTVPEFIVEASGTASLGAIVLGPPQPLRGAVRDSEGALVPGTLVTARQSGYAGWVWSATTDALGGFELLLPGGTYVVTFAPPSGWPSGAYSQRVVEAGSALDVTLDAGTTLTGEVRLDGAAAAWSLLEVRDVESDVLVGRATANEDGVFSLRIRPPDATPDTGE
jgi:hypothetical protein